MRKAFIITLLIFFAFSGPSLFAGAKPLKIGVYNLQRIFIESKVISGYRQKMDKELEAKRKTFSERQEKARQIEERVRREGQALSTEERRSLDEKLASELKELKRLREDLDIELQRLERGLREKALKEIGEVIKGLGEKEGYSIIFEKNAAGVIYLDDPLDITKKIIETYDRR